MPKAATQTQTVRDYFIQIKLSCFVSFCELSLGQVGKIGFVTLCSTLAMKIPFKWDEDEEASSYSDRESEEEDEEESESEESDQDPKRKKPKAKAKSKVKPTNKKGKKPMKKGNGSAKKSKPKESRTSKKGDNMIFRYPSWRQVPDPRLFFKSFCRCFPVLFSFDKKTRSSYTHTKGKIYLQTFKESHLREFMTLAEPKAASSMKLGELTSRELRRGRFTATSSNLLARNLIRNLSRFGI